MSTDLEKMGSERKPVSGFWKPSEPQRLVGKLDRVEAGKKFGDYAVFPKCIILRVADNKPVFAGSRVLGISAHLEGRITAADSGRYFVITFTGFGEAAAGNNAPRLFNVVVVDAAREKELIGAMADAAKRVAHDAPTAPEADADDELPF